LKDNEHYSQYWNEKNISKVAAIRSPCTWRTEKQILNLQSNEDMDYWYKYLNSGIVFNIHGNDLMMMSGADVDGDICLTTDQKEFIEDSYAEFLPPTYERKTAEKKVIIEDELWQYDIKTFKSRIGLITNIGTQLFAMLPLFDKDSEEYKEILNRLKICNCFQSMEIDRAKGIQTMDIPRYWTKWEQLTGDETEEELKIKELHHKVICDKRPYFFRYLYSTYDNQYKKRLATYDNYCESKFNETLKQVLLKEYKSFEEQRIADNYYKFGELLDSDCTMNNICHYMESKVKELKLNNQLKPFSFDKIITNQEQFREKNHIIIENLFVKYKKYKQEINYHSNSSGFQEMMKWLRNQIDTIYISSEEIVWWASEFGSSFILDVFSEELIEVLKKYSNRQVMIPVKSKEGYIDYMGSKYEILKIGL
jgi:hypothetical protein